MRAGNRRRIERLCRSATHLCAAAASRQRAPAGTYGSAARSRRSRAATARRNSSRDSNRPSSAAGRGCRSRPARIRLDGRLLELGRRRLGVGARSMGVAALAGRLLGSRPLGSWIWPRALGARTLAMRARRRNWENVFRVACSVKDIEPAPASLLISVTEHGTRNTPPATRNPRPGAYPLSPVFVESLNLCPSPFVCVSPALVPLTARLPVSA